ncbi:PREDICTED: UTP--glucose-1-phosphate uridylyltransferase 3, chloroplastic-like [Tarenaya hassleriana]|uniref:UTP--glucose-1-phosphate uridylyltransferase 3, chloroplastic-like n=1 Tax=Tarenaya hassleriana TaxID=28532 RepID=UPI00053C79C3|nr:PREDICTED: UTP--glucose-1-phosphate uridylyltransferase 3, chloroplastic-like [Tarenaya hassleriana]
MAPQASPFLHHHSHKLFFFSCPSSSSSFSRFHHRKPLVSLPSSSTSSSLSSSSAFSTLSLFSEFPYRERRCSYQVTRVSTAPVEYATPTPPESDDFLSEIARLKSLRSKLAVSRELHQKDAVIDADSRVRRFFTENRGGFAEVLGSIGLNLREMFLAKCLVAAGQEHALSLGYEEAFGEAEEYSVRSSVKNALYALVEMIERFDINSNGVEARREHGVVLSAEEVGRLRKFLKFLEDVEQFYDCIGGIIGYQIMVLELLHQASKRQITNRSQLVEESLDCQYLEIHAPNVIDLTQKKEYASQAAVWGIEGLPELGEIYPLGGAADRLGLVDPETGECLPAAMLNYCGRTLLEGLIRDLQAREFLYFKLYGEQCITPVAIMTSPAKNNHEHVTSLCKRFRWFGRGQSNFRVFEQPLVPAVSAEDGQWIISEPFVPVSKPGGHGVIWKLAHDKGVFKWFYARGRKGATIRQVGNVVAATDLTLLALAGIGLQYQKKLGFASCERNSGATEGINVLVEKKNSDGKWKYGISCIEYTEFDKFGISSKPFSSNGSQANFPANTNILYVDLPSAELIGSSSNAKSLPNMVLNTKKWIEYVDQYGDYHKVSGGRLECTMQNIADHFSNTFPSRCIDSIELEDKLDTFIVHNERRRVTSSAKKKRKQASGELHQTPDGALLDVLRNAYDLLTQCDIELPKIEANDKYVESPPPYLIFLHPALGPLWEVMRQKFSRGSISKCSELQLEVAEFWWNNVQVDGSLIVMAENAMGSTRINENGEPILHYGHRCGKCKLQNVEILNRGIDWNCKTNVYWKHHVHRLETCKIVLHGNAEFEASNVTIQGDQVFEVPDGHRLKITPANSGGVDMKLEPIKEELMSSGTWGWKYKLQGTHIQLQQQLAAEAS